MNKKLYGSAKFLNEVYTQNGCVEKYNRRISNEKLLFNWNFHRSYCFMQSIRFGRLYCR